MRLLPFAVAGLLAGSALHAQDTPRWRFGITLAAPARVLEVNSNEAPDSNNSHVDLGFGFGVEATRLWWTSPKGAVGVFARVSLAKTNEELGGQNWSPGWAVIGEAGVRLRRQFNRGIGMFVGAGLSHWGGPDDVAPFSGIGAILASGDAGVTLRIAPGLVTDLLATATRINGDDERSVSSGFVWRLMLGVHREK